MVLRPLRATIWPLVISRGPGGLLLRRFGVAAMAGPPLLAVAIQGVLPLSEGPDLGLALAILSAVSIPLGMAVVFFTARTIEQAHVALAASREQARRLIEDSADGVFVADLEGRYTYVNEAGCAMLGRSRSEIVGRTIVDLIPAEEVPQLADAKARLMAGGTHTAEWHLKKGDGTFVTVEVSAKILADGRWQGVVRDISARRAAEDALRRSEARLEAIVSIAADAIISIDGSQRIVLFNGGAEHLFGWSAADILGQPLDVILPERLIATHREHIRDFDVEESTARMMHGRPLVLGRRKSGAEFPAEAAISKIALDGQRLFTVIVRDVTERRDLERALSQSADRFRLLAEAGEVLGSSLELDQSLREVAALAARSIATACLIEVSPDDARVTRVWANRTGAADVRVEEETWSPARGEVPDWRSSGRLGRGAVERLGAPPGVSVIEVPITVGARPVGGIAFVGADAVTTYGPADIQLALDLARRIALAVENSRLYRAARAATHARDEMLSIVAHDLRTPLAAAQLSATLLTHHVPVERREASRTAAEGIERSIRLASRLVDDLLDVARIEAGKLAIDRRPIPPVVLVRQAVDSTLASAEEAGVVLDGAADPNLPLVLADQDRVQQVFSNLLSNALKFTPRGGRVRLSARAAGDDVSFSVSDSGAGIPAEHLPHVFDRFWQAGSFDRRGAGLGLSIAKGIVAAHDGRIQAESTLGAGSCFTFTLPAATRRPD